MEAQIVWSKENILVVLAAARGISDESIIKRNKAQMREEVIRLMEDSDYYHRASETVAK